MNPKEYKSSHTSEQLLNLISAVKTLVAVSPAQLIGIKNTSSQMVYYSDSYAHFLGFEQDDILGKKTMLELYDNPNIENSILTEDKMVLEKQKPLRVLKINKVGKTLKPYVCVKSPLIDPESKQSIGILLQGFEISILNLNRHIMESYSQFKKSSTDIKLPDLSKRERQVIFFFMAQLTSQEIAETIYRLEGKKVSKSTIDSVFNDQLYLKFDVHSRSALHEKLKQFGYDKLIPSEVLSSMSIPLESVNIF